MLQDGVLSAKWHGRSATVLLYSWLSWIQYYRGSSKISWAYRRRPIQSDCSMLPICPCFSYMAVIGKTLPLPVCLRVTAVNKTWLQLFGDRLPPSRQPVQLACNLKWLLRGVEGVVRSASGELVHHNKKDLMQSLGSIFFPRQKEVAALMLLMCYWAIKGEEWKQRMNWWSSLVTNVILDWKSCKATLLRE